MSEPTSGDRYVCAVPDVYAELYIDDELYYRPGVWIYLNGVLVANLTPVGLPSRSSDDKAAQAGDAWLRSLGWRRDEKAVGV